MLYELTRELITKIFQDKILFGLVIVLILGVFVGGMTQNSVKTVHTPQQESSSSPKNTSSSLQESATPTSKSQNTNQEDSSHVPLEPKLASDFVSWWLQLAMDYNPQSAQHAHVQAFNWMTPETAQAFQSLFWTPEIAQAILTGKVRGDFQVLSIHSIAANPDGSIVVSVQGHWVLQNGAYPVVHQCKTDFLIKREAAGLRVVGMYNQTTRLPSSSIY